MNDESTPLVELSRRIEARPETVWSILTTPERFSRWMGAKVEFSPEVGSPFRADFPQFQTVIAGAIEALDPDARTIALTWGVESGPQAEGLPAGSTLLSLSVHAVEGGARVDLEHSRFPSKASAAEHGGGWQFHLSRLAMFANEDDLTSVLDGALDTWYRAWNETDAAARGELLAACCTEDVAYKDEWTDHAGRDLLSMHIANCQRFVPGWTIARAGDATVCRGEALVRWRSVGGQGEEIEGTSHLRIGIDGKIRRVTGFPDP